MAFENLFPLSCLPMRSHRVVHDGIERHLPAAAWGSAQFNGNIMHNALLLGSAIFLN
jgi:hypothetical protein